MEYWKKDEQVGGVTVRRLSFQLFDPPLSVETRIKMAKIEH
jgi:hypothetical protein